MKPKICIGVPTNRLIKPKTVLSLLNIIDKSKYDYHFLIASEGYTISENRTYIVTQAIKNKCTHLLFVDDDMIFPENTIDQLISHGKEIVGTVAHSRALPPMPVVEFLNEDEVSVADRLLGKWNIPKELFEVKAVGGGVLFIDLKVFETLGKPWFSTETWEFGMTKMGEDSWFCQKAREAGFKIWCDPTLTIGHIGDYIY